MPATLAMAGATTTGVTAAGPAAGCTLAPHPLLRLVTGDSVTQTRVSGACAGRGPETELTLPPEPTVSRVHAQFTCSAGEWRVTCASRNGLAVNGVPVTGEQAVRPGDVIRWGEHPDALTSRVELER
jgi:hypothetical protein